MSHGIRRYLRETRFSRNNSAGEAFSTNPNKRRDDISTPLSPQSEELKTPSIDPWNTGWEQGSDNDWVRSGGGYKSVSVPAFSISNKQNKLQKDSTIDNNILP
jgi:hypothetical protein